MNQIAQEDVLRALKKFKRLAKQDFLASSLMSDPPFWSEQAQARREVYDRLMQWVDSDGVESAYQRAQTWYATLPRLRSSHPDATAHGQEQALEMFFTVLGVAADEVEAWKAQRPHQSDSPGSPVAEERASDEGVSRLSLGVGGA